MKQRGKKRQGASLQVVDITKLGRPEPPPVLTREEAEVWREAIDSMRRGWFTGALRPLLRNSPRADGDEAE
jgi:hypothetical protein